MSYFGWLRLGCTGISKAVREREFLIKISIITNLLIFVLGCNTSQSSTISNKSETPDLSTMQGISIWKPQNKLLYSSKLYDFDYLNLNREVKSLTANEKESEVLDANKADLILSVMLDKGKGYIALNYSKDKRQLYFPEEQKVYNLSVNAVGLIEAAKPSPGYNAIIYRGIPYAGRPPAQKINPSTMVQIGEVENTMYYVKKSEYGDPDVIFYTQNKETDKDGLLVFNGLSRP